MTFIYAVETELALPCIVQHSVHRHHVLYSQEIIHYKGMFVWSDYPSSLHFNQVFNEMRLSETNLTVFLPWNLLTISLSWLLSQICQAKLIYDEFIFTKKYSKTALENNESMHDMRQLEVICLLQLYVNLVCLCMPSIQYKAIR